METKEYLEYFKHYFQNLAQFRKEKIKNYLLENNICPITFSENGMPIDNAKKNEFDFVMECFLQYKEAIILFQKYELFRNYKYSIFYEIENFDEVKIKKLISEKKEKYFAIDKSIENFNLYIDEKNNAIKIEKGYFFNAEENIYIKIPIGIEKYDDVFFQNIKTKMNFLCIIDSKNKILEVRYDGLSYPFKTTQEFYLTLEAEAVKFIMSTLNLKLKSKDLEFLSKNVDQIKQEGFKIVRKKNHFNDEGGATLHSNRKNMLPYVDDLKELLDYKLKQFTIGTIEYQIADELSREIKQFLIEKEEESSCLNIILEIENYRTHFNFLMEKEISCIVQHEYMDTKNDGGRGDYVRSVILQLEEKFNRVGNQRE